MLKNRRLALFASAACLALLYARPSCAQAASDKAQATSGPNKLEEIVVTARRTSENLQRVPIAATVLSSVALEKQQIRRASDLQFSAPSLVITPDPLGGSAAPVFQLRGLTSPLGTDNTVVEYFGEVPVDARVVAAGLYDLSTVQVLRGPQGTLFGKNSTGGAVIFTPKKAGTESTDGYVDTTFGNYGLQQYTGAINVPLIKDVLGVRISGQDAQQDGFVKNLSGPAGNDKNYDAARIAVTFTPPGGVFENDFLATYFGGWQHGNPPIVTAIGGYAYYFPAAVADFAHQQALGPRTIDQSENAGNDTNRSELISNVSTYKFDFATLKNIIGFSQSNSYVGLDLTSFQFPLVDVDQFRRFHEFSDELNLSGVAFDDSLKWIVGGFYSNQNTTVHEVTKIFSPQPTSDITSYDRYVSKALYGQATYDLSKLGLSGVKLTGGLRDTWDSRNGVSTADPVPLAFQNSQISWTMGLDYQLTHNILLYVASRHSYKAGGFNLISPFLPVQLQSYGPEKLTDEELGIKATFNVGDAPIRTDLALYRGDYKNIQTQLTGECQGTNGLSSFIINAAEGTPQGIEFEFQAEPVHDFHLSGFYDLTLGTYDQFIPPRVSGCSFLNESMLGDLTGQNFGGISRHTASLTADVIIPTPERIGVLDLSGNWYYKSDRLGNALSGFSSPMPGYSLLNFRLDWNNIARTQFSVGVFVKNATNKLYGLTRNNTIALVGYDETTYGDPRTVGVELNYKF